MTQYRQSPPKKATKNPPMWAWLFSGLLLGILVTAMVFAYMNPTLAEKKTPKTKKIASTKLDRKNKKANSTRTAQRFEFYQLLPGMEVAVSDPPKKKTPPPKPPVKSDKKETPVQTPKPVKPPKEVAQAEKPHQVTIQKRVAAAQYIVQVETYRDYQHADALRKKLAANHFSPKINKVETENGTWFRVTLGPFASESTALRQKKQLEKHHVRGILLLQR